MEKICLASDNFSPVHPLIIEAICHANQGPSPAYGSDAWTKQAEELMQKEFRPCKALFVPTGTGANIVALQLACQRHQSVICADTAHIHHQEAGAAEALVGCKLLTTPSIQGKITPQEILKKLHHERAFGRHSTSPRVLSIAQPTETGTVYTLKELQALSKLCKEEHLLFHMDGSRLYNAAVSLQASLQELTQFADLLSLGGTKNGLMGAEALLIFNPLLQESAEHLQKQNLQLLSKMRYLSAQYLAFFKQNLWHTLASHANQKAQEIASILEKMPALSLSYPVETNQIFFSAPSSWIPLIQENISCFVWNAEKQQIRFISSWNTTEQEVKEVEKLLRKLSG